ncbi:calnexin-like isoform X2 [Physella acuta]|uniref:calnexin-like isoform X2 n=1 Tax=Physella acuta TaxID=109671 RepID=UPI0027DB5EB3|nr:calnexin-like isoform X2 [Physella acuta]
MKAWYCLCIVSISLLILSAVLVSATDFEDEEEDKDDGIVETEDKEEPQIFHKERPVYERPVPSGQTYFYEPFDTRAEFLKRWVQSQAKKDGAEEHLAKYDGKWVIDEPKESPIINDLGLILKSKAKHHAIAAKLDKPFEFNGKPLIVQYEVKFQNGIDCGGAYIKLLSKGENLNLKSFTDKTPYTIMFGPDKCGNDHKLHFIFRHKNLKTGVFEEKHAEKPTAKLDNFFTDRKTHLYTLTVNPDNTYEVKVDNGVVASGDLLTNFSPPVNPPKEIEDPDDQKPADWDDRERIPDPEAKKPEDWDESEPATIIDEDAVIPSGWLEDEEVYIPDPSATKPADWDDEMDGEWEAPRIDNPKCKDAAGCGKWEKPSIPNPKYKGTWKAPMIENPNYKGEWKPKVIPNPNYFEDKNPYKMTPIGAIGLELWSMTDDILFDNFIIADNETVINELTALTWEVKSVQERAAASTGQSIMQAIKDATNERPWLWAVVILVVVLPIVLIITYLCTGSVKPEDIDAHRKKFDDPSPDDEVDEVKDEEAEKTEEAEGVTAEAPDEISEAGAGGDGNSQNEEADEGDDESESKGSPKKTNSPRKRKTRKE